MEPMMVVLVYMTFYPPGLFTVHTERMLNNDFTIITNFMQSEVKNKF